MSRGLSVYKSINSDNCKYVISPGLTNLYLISSGALLESIGKNAKSRTKKQLSYQEFEGSTVDAWGESDDDIIKLSGSPSHSADIRSNEEEQIPSVSLPIQRYIRHRNFRTSRFSDITNVR